LSFSIYKTYALRIIGFLRPFIFIEFRRTNREVYAKIKNIFVSVKRLAMSVYLVCQQMNGVWKVKHGNMVPLFQQAKQLAAELGLPITYNHVPREQNKVADSYVNKALDNLL